MNPYKDLLVITIQNQIASLWIPIEIYPHKSFSTGLNKLLLIQMKIYLLFYQVEYSLGQADRRLYG